MIFVHTGGPDNDPTFKLMDAEDVKAWGGQRVVVTDAKGERSKRTALQNRSIHKYWAIIVEKLNAAGWTKKKYYEVKEVDIEWTPESFGEDVWRGIQDAMYQHRKTSKLETEQVSRVYEVVNKHMANTCGVSEDFPSKESLISMAFGNK
jgi:hypothetical protein